MAAKFGQPQPSQSKLDPTLSPSSFAALQEQMARMNLNGLDMSRTAGDSFQTVDVRPAGVRRVSTDSKRRPQLVQYMFCRAEPDPGQNSSWQKANRKRVEVSSESLLAQVKNSKQHKKGNAVTEVYQKLKPNQQLQLDRLIADKNLEERCFNGKEEWVLAHIKPERRNTRQKHALVVDTVAIYVIIKKQPRESIPAVLANAGAVPQRFPQLTPNMGSPRPTGVYGATSNTGINLPSAQPNLRPGAAGHSLDAARNLQAHQIGEPQPAMPPHMNPQLFGSQPTGAQPSIPHQPTPQLFGSQPTKTQPHVYHGRGVAAVNVESHRDRQGPSPTLNAQPTQYHPGQASNNSGSSMRDRAPYHPQPQSPIQHMGHGGHQQPHHHHPLPADFEAIPRAAGGKASGARKSPRVVHSPSPAQDLAWDMSDGSEFSFVSDDSEQDFGSTPPSSISSRSVRSDGQKPPMVEILPALGRQQRRGGSAHGKHHRSSSDAPVQLHQSDDGDDDDIVHIFEQEPPPPPRVSRHSYHQTPADGQAQQGHHHRHQAQYLGSGAQGPNLVRSGHGPGPATRYPGESVQQRSAHGGHFTHEPDMVHRGHGTAYVRPSRSPPIGVSARLNGYPQGF
ncbi:MAG: hypothetical protein M1817_005650 [Caeruleum heppii]|nr:MAG: hypothetical protein M1817_005650 [Caeruleum heppii]